MRTTSHRQAHVARLLVLLALLAAIGTAGCKKATALVEDTPTEELTEDGDAALASEDAADGADADAKHGADVGKKPDVVDVLVDDTQADDSAAEDDVAAEDVALDDVQAEDAATADVPPPTPETLLFIGNSYTYVNDLPGMVVKLAKSLGLPWTQTSETVGGATLADHINLYGALTLIAAGGHTRVVLQGQSVEPAGDPAFLTAAKTLGTAVNAAKAQPVFYQTWPRKPGDALYQQAWSGGTPEAFFALLKQGYETAAQQSGGIRVPAGDAWMLVLAAHPEIALHQDDGSHPTVAGTYLTACVFVGMLAGLDPGTFAWTPAGVPLTTAQILREAARTVLGW